MPSAVENLCSSAAASADAATCGDGENVGVVEMVPIIMSLLPMLTALPCFQRNGADDPKGFVADHYDAGTDTFAPGFVQQLRRQTRRAARLEGQGRLSISRLDAITHATLVHAMRADDADVMAFCASHQ